MKKYIFLIGILLPLLSYSQNTDSLTRAKLTTTAPRLGGITISNMLAPVTANGNTFIMQQPVADIGIPLYKKFLTKHPIVVRAGIRYQGLLLSNEKNISSTNFHSITIPILFNYSLSRATTITFIGLASVASDFKQDLEANDVLYTAGVRVGFHQNKAFKYGVTLTYSHNYSGSFLLPLPDIDWTISKRLSLAGILPARVSLRYKINTTQSLGITTSVNGVMYRLHQEKQAQYVHLRQNSGGLIYDLTFGRRWKLNLIAGHTFMQKLETFNIDQSVSLNKFGKLNDRISNVSYHQNSFIFQGGIGYQF
jgi:hypothetical protein